MKKKILPTLAAVFFVPLSAIHAVEVQKLRCEYLKDPLGIDAAQPKSSDALMASQWIWYPEGNPANSAPAGLRYFQRTMEVDAAKTVESATASLSADNEFTLWINGKKISEGKDFKVPVKSSIASFLRPGANVISVAVNNAGPAASPAGWIGAFEVSYKDGTKTVVNSDAKWSAGMTAPEGWQLGAVVSGEQILSEYLPLIAKFAPSLATRLSPETQPLDQSVYGNDFWETSFDPDSKTYTVTYNLPLDGKPNTTWILKKLQQPK